MKRLACYGWVGEDAGSVASANYLVLRELLRRGISVDLYANREHVPCPQGLNGDFHYMGLEPPVVVRKLSRGGQKVINWLLSPVVAEAWRRVYEPAVEARHAAAAYDAVLALGTPPAFTVSDVPTVTWLQGPRQTELEAIKRLRPQIERVSGRSFYWSLVSYYTLDALLQRKVLDASDRIICGSDWARRAIQRDLAGIPVDALPYPIDLDRFRPREDLDVDWERPTILSIGRLDPRKRLDLLLDAFGLVLDVWPRARLRIVGRPGYAPNQLSLLEQSPHREFIDYRSAVSRQEVPSLLQEAAVLVQPSENENFGSAVAEALACGVPTVTGCSNGTAQYVDSTSEVFDTYTPEAVAAAIARVVGRHRDETARVRRSARECAERAFSASSITERLLRIVGGPPTDGGNAEKVESSSSRQTESLLGAA